MNRYLTALAIIIISFSACKKEKFDSPTASFSVNGVNGDTLVILTYNSFQVTNSSSNADSYFWDLGNGTTSTNKEVTLMYPKKGMYTVSLVASSHGNESVSKKIIKVVTPVLKQVSVSSLNFDSSYTRPACGHIFSKADVWVEILEGASNTTYPYLSTGTFDAPVIYKSKVAVNVDPSAAPIAFEVPKSIDLDLAIMMDRYGYTGIGYGINLYVQDATGVYLLSSNFWGGSVTRFEWDLGANQFSFKGIFMRNTVQITGNFE